LAATTTIATAAKAPTARPAPGPASMNAATIGTASATMMIGNVHGFSRTGSSFLTEAPSRDRRSVRG
jgi:hypothetical protein